MKVTVIVLRIDNRATPEQGGDVKWSALELLLLALATYRVSLMVSKEAGPFWAFKLFRRSVKKNAPKQIHLDDGIECLWCVSAQMGIVIAVSSHFFWEYAAYRIGIIALALSAVAVIANQMFTKGKV